MSRLCQSHCVAHPCILQICTEASLPSPPCGPRNVFAIELRLHEVSVKKQPQSFHQRCLSLGLLWLLRLLWFLLFVWFVLFFLLFLLFLFFFFFVFFLISCFPCSSWSSCSSRSSCSCCCFRHVQMCMVANHRGALATGALDGRQLLAIEGSKRKSAEAEHSTSNWTEPEKWRQYLRKSPAATAT